MAELSTIQEAKAKQANSTDIWPVKTHTPQTLNESFAWDCVSPSPTINVLLVDDQEIVGKVIQRILASEADITLCYCSDAQQALQIAIKQSPTVILLDLVMPTIDGLLLLRWLKRHSATRDIPVVMLSATEEPKLKAKAFTQGANDYLIKPPDALELIARIRYHACSYRNFKGMIAANYLAQTKSRQLEQALQTLRSTQGQLIQTEKLAGLAQLVAGIAHEINNPINFIHGNLNYAQDYVSQLLHFAQSSYQQNCSLSCTGIHEYPDQSELEFIAEDLPKLLKSMKVGTDRIRQIILSLRKFSHLDESDLKTVNIHEGIDSALLILQHRLTATTTHSDIRVNKDYSELPLIECYPAQLNQVFMNVLSNAIDAIEEMRRQTGKAYRGQIDIRTEAATHNSSMATIRITDNGCGIAEAVQSRIFDPFFTTKTVGKGTGLGLFSSYQIIVHQHCGIMEYTSVPGQGTEFQINIPLAQCK